MKMVKMSWSLHHLMVLYYLESLDKVLLQWQESLKSLRLLKSLLRFRNSSKQLKMADFMKPSDLELLRQCPLSNNSNMKKPFIRYQLIKKKELVHLPNVFLRCLQMFNTVLLKDQNGKLKLSLSKCE
jgi:hypothetical protein